MFDVIVIGGGPAGASAAIYLQRLKLLVLMIMKDEGTLGKTNHIDNYWGFENTVSGKYLVEQGVSQAKRLGVKVVVDEVLGIENFEDFVVKTTKGEYQSKSVLLATGAAKANVKAKGYRDFIGKGISFCAICDGFLYRDKKIGVIGNKDFMLEEIEVLKNFSKDITIFTNDLPLEVDVEERVITEKIIEFQGADVIKRIITEDNSYDIDVVFVAIGTPSANDFALRMGAFIEKNSIDIDKNFMTNIPGLFAAGDCIGGLLQIVKAASDGPHAALAINKYLKSFE
jgi:thioredoxin reductase (NADPH)